jgi:hypothetical protein
MEGLNRKLLREVYTRELVCGDWRVFMPKQQAVFAAIGRERAKQDRDCNTPFSVHEEMQFIDDIVFVHERMDGVLRIAAIAVRCLENHGLPSDPEDTDELPGGGAS